MAKETKIREIWLGAWIVSIAMAAVNTVQQQLANPVLQASPRLQLGSILFCLALTAIFGYGGYYCAYKNAGTKFVTFCSVMTIGTIVAMIALHVTGKLVPPANVSYYWLKFAWRQTIGLLWAILCWKMRKENQKFYDGLIEPN